VPSNFSSCLVLRLVRKGASVLPFLQSLEESGLDLKKVKGDSGEDTAVCKEAAHSGSIEMMIHVRSKGCRWDNVVLLTAAQCNRTAMLRWLREQEPSWKWPKDLVSNARSLGADECAQWA
jgi:hypothetical protein